MMSHQDFLRLSQCRYKNFFKKKSDNVELDLNVTQRGYFEFSKGV